MVCLNSQVVNDSSSKIRQLQDKEMRQDLFSIKLRCYSINGIEDASRIEQ